MAKRTVRLLSGEQYFNDILPIFVNRNVESYELTEHHHNFLELSYVGEGVGTHHIGDKTMKVSRGDLFLIPVGESHVFRPGSRDPSRQLVVYNCILPLEAARRLLEAVPESDKLQQLLEIRGIRHYRDSFGEAKEWFERLYREYSVHRLGRTAALLAGVIQLFTCFARLHFEDEGLPLYREAASKLDALLVGMRQACHLSYKINTLADQLNVGERQFQRLFLAHTGMNFTAYLQKLRIDEACRLLRTTDHKTSSIAASVGYGNTAFFTELFKRLTGTTPTKFRKHYCGN